MFLPSSPEFEEHAKVLDGASDLLVEIFGPAGVHVRSVSVLTAHLIDESGQPTTAARDEILSFFTKKLLPA